MASVLRRPRKALLRARSAAGAFVVDNFFRAISRAGKLHPKADPDRHGLEVLTDVAYDPGGAEHHRLDIYRPRDRRGPLPVVLYVHGGGFRILSKDTHWIMALAFARRGMIVFSINYRLAPQHRFPAAIDDAARALSWVHAHAAAYGGDPDRLVLAGESAGANLVTSLAVATSYKRPEPFAQALYSAGVRPRVVLPACGIFQVTDTKRFGRRRVLPIFIRDRIAEVSHAYLGERADHVGHDDLALADPLVFLERGLPPDRPLPPFFLPVGTKDPLLDDTRRLGAALQQLSVPTRVEYYPGEVHAFHALVFRPAARRCWQHTYEFLDEHLPAAAGASRAA